MLAPDLPKNLPSKIAPFNSLYAKTQKSPIDCFLSAVRKPDHIFSHGPEVPVILGCALKIAFGKGNDLWKREGREGAQPLDKDEPPITISRYVQLA
jgi:hypothetical protein